MQKRSVAQVVFYERFAVAVPRRVPSVSPSTRLPLPLTLRCTGARICPISTQRARTTLVYDRKRMQVILLARGVDITTRLMKAEIWRYG
jgi:hypothetical protein